MTRRALSLSAVVLLVACRGREREPAEVTFNRDIAPIVFASCSPCHRPGEAGPFSLLDYEDVAERAREIVEVTRSRFMPPWLPDTPEVDYVGQRRLSDEQVALFEHWHEQGSAEGNADDLPPRPVFPEGWQLGEPDLALALDEPFALAAEGVDVIRNFVLPVPLNGPRWVRAVEIRAGNSRGVHHAILKRDRTDRSRRLDQRDEAPGFAGMELGGAEYPEGQIIVWTPGTTPHAGDPRIAWSLEPGDDLVLQLHMVPTGKVESVGPRIGFHFSDRAPDLVPSTVLLRNDRIDIPAGAAAHEVRDSFTLPVAVDVLGVYPHAHYLGRRMEIWADPPGGDRIWLLRIPSWDFNWQGMYHVVQPIALEAGSTVSFRYVYDNTTDNPRNPHRPPERVRIGNRSSDEMATLAIQVLPKGEDAGTQLLIAQWQDLLRDHPDNPAGYYNLGVAYASAGDLPRAIEHYERALALEPADAETHYLLAGALYRSGATDRAIDEYTLAVRHDPQMAEARVVLGFLLGRRGELDSAASQLERAIEIDPRLAKAHYFLGEVREGEGDTSGARSSYRTALELDAGLAEAARALARLGD